MTINRAPPSTPIAAGAVVDYCESGAFPGYKLKWGLSNKNDTVNYKAKLKVTFSD
jgi:hypothetical protein